VESSRNEYFLVRIMAPHIAPMAAPFGRRAGVRRASMGVTCRAGSHRIPTPPECAPFAVTRHWEFTDPTLGALAPGFKRKGSITLVSETQRKSTRFGMAHPEAVSSVVAPSKNPQLRPGREMMFHRTSPPGTMPLPRRTMPRYCTCQCICPGVL